MLNLNVSHLGEHFEHKHDHILTNFSISSRGVGQFHGRGHLPKAFRILDIPEYSGIGLLRIFRNIPDRNTRPSLLIDAWIWYQQSPQPWSMRVPQKKWPNATFEIVQNIPEYTPPCCLSRSRRRAIWNVSQS